jgi:hypothetical protein
MIFVFGSNLGGRHAAGAARFAVEKHGAIMGQHFGHQGNAFAIPTCDAMIEPLPLTEIAQYVDNFLAYARQHPTLTFQVTRIGCGIAGFTDEEIAPLFEKATSNCYFPPEWAKFLLGHNIW